MFFQIREVIIWPKNISFKPKRLIFETGKVNIITGNSRTGKSALIPIIDYCLGSGRCSIPVDIIREFSSWFGVLVETTTGLKLFARREPGDQKSTGDMFILEGGNIEIPDIIENKNTNVDAAKLLLDELAGLTMLDFDTDQTNSGFKGRPSFRDLSAFNFQPQNVVANPDVFFFKADTYEHREKLRSIFPYILNVVSPHVLAKQHELAQLSKDLKRKENEFNTINKVSERWLAEIQSKVSEAKEFGLIQRPTDAMTREELLIELQSVVNESTYEIKVTGESLNASVEEAIKLQQEETSVSNDLSGARRRLFEMSDFQDSTIQYKGALHIQRDRLKISEWLYKKDNTDVNCPICGNQMDRETSQIEQLYESLKEIEETTKDFSYVPAAFDRELERVKKEIKQLTEKLTGIRIRRDNLEKISEAARKRQLDSLSLARFLGNLEQTLATIGNIGTDSELQLELSILSRRIVQILSEISEEKIEERKGRALARVNLYAGRLLPTLDVQRPNDPVSLQINDLTIKVSSSNREDYLWEIGSGSNHLSYHIAVTLALHQYFLELEHSPVPSFIIYDQPSQAYFPQRLKERENEEDYDLKDEDLQAVRKIFSTIASAVRTAEGKLQVIVFEHAGKEAWGDMPEVALIADWHNGKKLIPAEWQSLNYL